MEQAVTDGVTASHPPVTLSDTARYSRNAKVPAIEALPPHLRTQVVDMLIANASLRDVAKHLTQHGHKLSHNSIARYKNQVLKPALDAGTKLRALQGVSSNPVEQAQETAVLTKAALAADPILQRVDLVWNRTLSSIDETEAQRITTDAGEKLIPADLKARASLLNVARGLIETEAKARQHPGFVATAPVAVDARQIVVVLPSTSAPVALPAAPEGDVIDVEAE
jgi:hypothetical protein